MSPARVWTAPRHPDRQRLGFNKESLLRASSQLASVFIGHQVMRQGASSTSRATSSGCWKMMVERDKSGHQVGASRSRMRSLTRFGHRERWLDSPGQGAKSAAVMPAG